MTTLLSLPCLTGHNHFLLIIQDLSRTMANFVSTKQLFLHRDAQRNQILLILVNLSCNPGIHTWTLHGLASGSMVVMTSLLGKRARAGGLRHRRWRWHQGLLRQWSCCWCCCCCSCRRDERQPGKDGIGGRWSGGGGCCCCCSVGHSCCS